jgi:hypothetical protein
MSTDTEILDINSEALRQVVDDVIHLAELPDATVTGRPVGGTPAAERKRQQRARDREQLFERDNCRLFLDPATLPQNCQPASLRRVVLRELVDNALDEAIDVLSHLPQL